MRIHLAATNLHLHKRAQVQDAMPLKTMRGIWRYKEQREGQVNSRLPLGPFFLCSFVRIVNSLSAISLECPRESHAFVGASFQSLLKDCRA